MREVTQAPTAVREARVERPGDVAETRDLLRETTGAVLFRGGGTKLDWGGAPEQVDLVVETSNLDRILEHNAEEATAVVEAGVPLRRLQDEFAAEDQWLAIDPPRVADGATVGGVLCADDTGPRRHHYGTMRDLVIGTTVVLSDGDVGRSGGKVIKNVAGYDLSKLWCGSLGTLGLVTRIALRLHPLPPASTTVRVAAGPEQASRLAIDVAGSPVVASALDWAEGALWVRVEGHADAVADQTRAVRRLAAERGVDDLDELTGGDEEAAWDRLVDGLAGEDGETVLRAGTLPDRLPEAARALEQAAEDAGVQVRFASHAGVGVHTARLSGGDAQDHARVARGWRRLLADAGGHVVVRRHVSGLEDHVDVWGEPGDDVVLMRRLKQRFDPDGRCAPGRFVGGI